MRSLVVTALCLVFVAALAGGPAMAQSVPLARENFAGRKAIIINNAEPNLRLSDFKFYNADSRTSSRLETDLKWANTGTKAIVAFEVVVLFYDPFNRQITSPSGRWMVEGRNSGDWGPLKPGDSSGDGTIGLRAEPAFTGIVYVRSIRFDDDTVWTSNQADIERQVRAAIPQLREIGNLDPAPKGQN